MGGAQGEGLAVPCLQPLTPALICPYHLIPLSGACSLLLLMPSKSLAKNLLVSCLKQTKRETDQPLHWTPHSSSQLPSQKPLHLSSAYCPPTLPSSSLTNGLLPLLSRAGALSLHPDSRPSPFTWLLSTPPIPKPHPHVGTPSSSYPGSVTLTGAPAPSSPIPPVPLGQPSEDNCPVATIRSHPLSQTPFSASSGSIPTGPSIT